MVAYRHSGELDRAKSTRSSVELGGASIEVVPQDFEQIEDNNVVPDDLPPPNEAIPDRCWEGHEAKVERDIFLYKEILGIVNAQVLLSFGRKQREDLLFLSDNFCRF